MMNKNHDYGEMERHEGKFTNRFNSSKIIKVKQLKIIKETQ